MPEDLDEAARLLRGATALLITAGAGMSADSGLPTYRGEDGLWTQNDPLKLPGMTPWSLAQDPAAAWRYYDVMARMFRAAVPHAGFTALLNAASRMRDGCWVYTSNIDEHFVRAGFDPERLVECHGSLFWGQCHLPCGNQLFPIDYDAPVPTCPKCDGGTRPNILLFNDMFWVGDRMNAQHNALDAWLDTLPPDARLVVLEIGAGTVVNSVRVCGEAVARRRKIPLVRINPNEPENDLGISRSKPSVATKINYRNTRARWRSARASAKRQSRRSTAAWFS